MGYNMAMKRDKHKSTTVVNKKALFDYEVLESMEAGLRLSGPEVKSLRIGQGSLRDSYVVITQKGAQLLNMTIPPYAYARQEEYDPKQTRSLLVHRQELERLRGLVQQKGVSLVPLKVYLKGKRYKVEVGVVRGKKQYEKREAIRRRDLDREMRREVKGWGR